MERRDRRDDGTKEQKGSMNNTEAFARWFRQATDNEPYPLQIRFTCGDWLRNVVPVPGHKAGRGEGLLVDVPTGMGKTAMAPSPNVGLLPVGVEEESVRHVP
jgi:hypothetical protein